MGISETKWKGIGQVKSDDYSVYFSGNDKIERKWVAFICTEKIKKCVLGFNPISDRIITIRIQGKPINFTFIQVYIPLQQQMKRRWIISTMPYKKQSI